MPRRTVLAPAQREALLALPQHDNDLARHYTLSEGDLAIVHRRRGEANRLGFALQLCVLRHPGRLLRRGEVIPERVMAFIGRQLGLEEEALGGYAVRVQPATCIPRRSRIFTASAPSPGSSAPSSPTLWPRPPWA